MRAKNIIINVSKIAVRYIILYIGRYKTSPYIGQYNHRDKILEIVYIDRQAANIDRYIKIARILAMVIILTDIWKVL